MNSNLENLKDMIQRNKTASIEDCTFCARKERCCDCAHLEMDRDGQGKRRCDYLWCWVNPSNKACGNFKPL